ncbi:hypothetical protein SLEP1_g23088 [Rubroshorea leprosula]|uniref:RNA-directed DNA polymerase n=1 Tax=Rubroshorea leprosula TaxID=152421 RepID=A0AAV5JIJ4_9ROSI|nr:hypothetical protein SLEP1_g23088 [Rubroshorea leprosula]
MARTFTGSRPPRNEIDEQEDAQLSKPGLNDFRPMPRNLFIGGAKQDQLSETNDDERTPTGYATQPEHVQIPIETRQRHPRPYNSQHERPERDAQSATVVATRNSPALSNIVVPTKLRGSGKLNNEPSSSKHNEELMRKNVDLERHLRDVQKSIDELKSPRSHQQTLDLDSAPLNLSITAEPYEEEFKIPHLETYDGSGDPDEHLHTYQAIMRIQNVNDAMMCKVFPATLKSTARRLYHKPSRHSIDSYSQLTKLFSNKFASQREIKRTATKLMQVHQKKGESLRDYMQRFNKATLDIDNVPDTIYLSTLLHGLKPGKFLDDLLENPPKSWNDVKSNPPQTHDPSRADRSKYCDYHRGYGHNTEDCQSLKDELEFLARNGKLEGYVQKPFVRQPTQTHFVQEYGQSQAPGHQLSSNPNPYQASQYSSEPTRAYRGRPFNKREQGQKASTQNQKDHRGVGYSGIPPPSGTINMISGGMHAGGPNARGRKTYACQPITFSPTDYKRAEGEPDVMMPHADPFVATVHIGNHNVNKVFIDIGSSPDILYWSCFQKMQLNPSSLQKYEGPIYGFDNQPVPVEGVITLPIYVGSEPRFRMASVSFLVMKMESAFNAILGRATLCELKAIISQPHLCMKFPTPQGVGVLKGNQKMARACYQDTFKKVELAAALAGSENHKSTQPDQQTMSISDIEHRPEGIGTKLTEEERAELLKFLRVNQVVFAWTMDVMPSILVELTVHKLNTDPTKRPVVQKRRLFGLQKQAAIDEEIQKLLQAGFIRRVEYSEWVSNPVLVKKPNGKWKMCIDFTNLNEACPKEPHPLPNVEKLVERAVGHEWMSFLDASSGYHQLVQCIKSWCNVSKAGAMYQKLVQIIFKLQIGRNIENLHRAQMKLNPLKCTFAIESGKFLGYVVSKKGIEVNPEKVQAVQQMEPPKTIKDVLRLTEEAISSVLLREENKHQKPICYVSKVLQGAEQNYPLAEKAAFALVYTAWKLRAYLQSHQIVVYTDLPLRKILQKPKLSGRLIGWSVELSEYDLKFQLRTTIKGQAMADFLVECISAIFEEKAPERPVWVLYVDGAANIEGSSAGAVLVGPDGFKSEHALRFKFQTTNNVAEYEALIYGLKLVSELKVQSIQDLNPHRSTIVEVLDAPSYTDFIVECQLFSIDPSSPSWTTPLINYLQSGELPEDPSAAKLIKREMLLSLSSPWPFAQWGVNLLDPFVKGKGGCTYLIVAVDYFTKWIEAKPLSATTKKKIEEFLFNSILYMFSIPKQIIADNGPQFRATALRSFCNDYGIELALTSVYTPQSNGQAESANKIILRGLKTRVLAAHSNWVDELNKVLWSCRTTPSSAIGETPFSLAYGAEAVIPIEVGLPSDRSDHHDDLNNEQLLTENLDLVAKVDDLVLRKAGLTNVYSHMGKLVPNWEGPYMVIYIKQPGCYQLADLQGRPLSFIWNIHNLRKFYS